MTRIVRTGAALCGATLALLAPAAAQATPGPGVVVRWNSFLLDLQAAPGHQPATVHPTYELAVMHKAIGDAVAGEASSDEAAVDAAAHDTLVALYPASASAIDDRYAGELDQLPPGRRRDRGLLSGRRAAARTLAGRAGDGSGAAPIPFSPDATPGAYQLTPPAFAPPVFTHWSHVRPFVLRRADQFRPAPPPALTSRRYASALNEVQRLGDVQGTHRTPDQTQIGLFWNTPIWTTWNRIAQAAVTTRHGTTAHDARVFATLNLALADSVIALYDAKYAYRFWRPVTAIRAADGDGNPSTVGDPAWTPLSATAPDPSYPGAHSVVSAAGAVVLDAFFGRRLGFSLGSAALPGVERGFAGFDDAAEEATVSRVYNGNHTPVDEAAGTLLGEDVGIFTLLTG